MEHPSYQNEQQSRATRMYDIMEQTYQAIMQGKTPDVIEQLISQVEQDKTWLQQVDYQFPTLPQVTIIAQFPDEELLDLLAMIPHIIHLVSIGEANAENYRELTVNVHPMSAFSQSVETLKVLEATGKIGSYTTTWAL
jgi:hypothetical protein